MFDNTSNGSGQSGPSNPPSSVVELIPNQREPSPELGPNNDSSGSPEPSKIPLTEFRNRRVQQKIRIKVLETYGVEKAVSRKGNIYPQLVVWFLLLSSMEKQAKRTAAYTEEANLIFGADLEPGRIYEVTRKEFDDGYLHWIAIEPVSPK